MMLFAIPACCFGSNAQAAEWTCQIAKIGNKHYKVVAQHDVVRNYFFDAVVCDATPVDDELTKACPKSKRNYRETFRTSGNDMTVGILYTQRQCSYSFPDKCTPGVNFPNKLPCDAWRKAPSLPWKLFPERPWNKGK